MTIGIFAASRVLPTVVEHQDNASPQGLLLLIIVILLIGAVIGQVAGYVIGLRLRLAIPRGGAERLDRVGGAASGVIGVLLAFWLLLPTMADTPGWPSQQARGSYVAGLVHDHLPEPP